MTGLQSAVHLQDGALWMEGVPLDSIAATVGTPTYVYSRAYITAQVHALQEAFDRSSMRIHYAVKANSNLAILSLLGELGAGFDIVSGGELHRVLAAGCNPKDVVFSGVGKQIEEVDLALRLGIECFNIESEAELRRVSERANLQGVVAPISIRVNPNVDAQTHPYISTGLKNNKFGVPPELAITMYQQAAQDANLKIVGIDCHIGSQITEIGPLLESLASILAMVDELASLGIDLEHIDLGGGMGITYQDEEPLHFQDYGAGVGQMMASRPQNIILEPGRSLVANAGVLLTRVEYLKPATAPDSPNFAVVDAAMNDLIRPALYQAWHEVATVNGETVNAATEETKTWQVVGPVCETGDFIAHDRELSLSEGALLCVGSAGAYGMVQASNYNSRGRAAEVLVNGDGYEIVRRRETIEDQLRLEYLK